jgi:hypothetical protein
MMSAGPSPSKLDFSWTIARGNLPRAMQRRLVATFAYFCHQKGWDEQELQAK